MNMLDTKDEQLLQALEAYQTYLLALLALGRQYTNMVQTFPNIVHAPRLINLATQTVVDNLELVQKRILYIKTSRNAGPARPELEIFASAEFSRK